MNFSQKKKVSDLNIVVSLVINFLFQSQQKNVDVESQNWGIGINQERFASANELLDLAFVKTLLPCKSSFEIMHGTHLPTNLPGYGIADVSSTNSTTNTAGLSKKQRKRLRQREREAQRAAVQMAVNKIESTIKTLPNKYSLEGNANIPQIPALSGMLYDLAVQFRTEICLLQMLMDSETQQNSKTTTGKELIVAEITLANNSPITKEAFQFMRSVILNAIEKYQKQKKATPLFYSMNHNNTYINILCEDAFAFGCLQDCVGRMSALGSVSMYPLQASAGRLYCYSVIYTGIINDPMKFLLQIRLHISKLRTDHWIIADSKVCTDDQGETQFLFLVDEISSIALEYRYGNRLFICLEEALFHNHGQLPNFF